MTPRGGMMAAAMADIDVRDPMSEHPQQEIRPTMSLYQNGDAVAGVLQQVFNEPLHTDTSIEVSQQGSATDEAGGGATGGVGGQAKAPLLGSLEAKIGADFRRRHQEDRATGSSRTTTSRFTQAYYLYVVRHELRRSGLIRPLTGRADADKLAPGEFVEFTCRFDPSQVAALLDIVTPDLVREVTRFMTRQSKMGSFEGADKDGVLAFIARLDSQVDAAGDLAYAIAAATGVDFRSSTTREFYGRVGEGDQAVTAITMCDPAHFVVDDEDRLLDGQFSVLAKVTDTVQEDRPILGRNKVLSRLDPRTVDYVLSEINAGALGDMQDDLAIKVAKAAGGGKGGGGGDMIARAAGGNTDSPAADKEPGMKEPKIDLTVDSRVRGPSIKVMPIAVYV